MRSGVPAGTIAGSLLDRRAASSQHVMVRAARNPSANQPGRGDSLFARFTDRANTQTCRIDSEQSALYGADE